MSYKNNVRIYKKCIKIFLKKKVWKKEKQSYFYFNDLIKKVFNEFKFIIENNNKKSIYIEYITIFLIIIFYKYIKKIDLSNKNNKKGLKKLKFRFKKIKLLFILL